MEEAVDLSLNGLQYEETRPHAGVGGDMSTNDELRDLVQELYSKISGLDIKAKVPDITFMQAQSRYAAETFFTFRYHFGR